MKSCSHFLLIFIKTNAGQQIIELTEVPLKAPVIQMQLLQ